MVMYRCSHAHTGVLCLVFPFLLIQDPSKGQTDLTLQNLKVSK